MEGSGRPRSKRHSGNHAVWRLLAAAPAALLSTMLITIGAGWLGPYTLLATAGWLVVAPLLLLQRPIERLAVHTAFGWQAPTGGRDAEWLAWLRERTEHCCRVPSGSLDWYLRHDPEPNAFAAGRHSIAVTTGLLHVLHAGQLTTDQVIAVAIHEVGHHASGSTRYGLVVTWLTWPWRTVSRAAFRLGDRLPFPRVGILLLPPVLAMAIGNAAGQPGPPARVVPVVILLIAVALATVVYPVLDAAISRAAERDADAYAAERGAGPDLADALHQLVPCRTRSALRWATDPHPAGSARQRALTGAVVACARSEEPASSGPVSEGQTALPVTGNAR